MLRRMQFFVVTTTMIVGLKDGFYVQNVIKKQNHLESEDPEAHSDIEGLNIN